MIVTVIKTGQERFQAAAWKTGTEAVRFFHSDGIFTSGEVYGKGYGLPKRFNPHNPLNGLKKRLIVEWFETDQDDWDDYSGGSAVVDLDGLDKLNVLEAQLGVKLATLLYTNEWRQYSEVRYGVEEAPEKQPAPKSETPKSTPKTKKMKEVKAPSNAQEALAQALALMMPQQEVDMDAVREMVRAEVEKQAPKTVEIKVADMPAKDVGHVHEKFKTLSMLLANRKNVWMAGPAGSGKTSAGFKAAQALNLPFYSISVCAQTTKSELFGYNDATGSYVESLFYKAFKDGGVFLIDEIDAGNPNVLSVLNAALENEECAFPCGMIKRHKDFVICAAANTVGSGGNMQYVGRNRIDAATLNRFFMIDWGYDEKLETLISPNKRFTKLVQKLRKFAVEKAMSAVISPRVSIHGGHMIEAGMKREEVLELLIWNKINKDETKQLKTKLAEV